MVIRMRHNRSQSGSRRSHHALKDVNLSVCSNCGALHRPHHMCLACGFYKGKLVMDMAAKQAKREARMQAKAERIAAQAAEMNPAADTEATPEVDPKPEAALPTEETAKKA